MNIESEERQNLEKVLNGISSEISKIEKSCEDGVDEVRELSKFHWESLTDMDEYEEAASMLNIDNRASDANKQFARLRHLKNVIESPYFGKINVEFDKDDKDEFYVGYLSLDDASGVQVVDWRSPISSVYYNSELGDTSYEGPFGTINCNLEGRRQLMIENKELKGIIDCSIHIDDDVLQHILAQSSNEKMKNIVRTIQEQQNEIIRTSKDKSIIVQGCAGSGKTSVGLHRIATILYNNRDTKSDNLLVFSPSNVFSEYISNVLPQFGERNAENTTFKDFAETFIKGFKKVENFTEFVARYYNGLNTSEQNRLIKFQFSNEFMEAIDEYVKRVSNEFKFNDAVTIGKESIPESYLNAILSTDSYNNKSIEDKIDMLTDDLCYTLFHNQFRMRREIKRVLTLAANKMNAKKLYNDFLSSNEFVKRFGSEHHIKGKDTISYPDAIGLLYLYFEMMGYPRNNRIHHVVIDEAQDYNPMQIKMIKKMFRGASFTVLGDANQTINPYHKYDSLQEMSKYIGKSSYIELNKAFRSTKEIMDYTNAFIANKVESIRNKGNTPVNVKSVSKENLFKELVSDIKTLKEKNFDRICIITRSKKESEAIYEGLKEDIDNLTVLTEDLDSIHTNTLISPAYMAKGLEFDAVISYNDEKKPYGEEDKYLYYVACTRAQHNLIVYNEPIKIKKIGGR